MSQALLSHYENGVRVPRLEFVVKACDYYNVTADYLLGRSKEKNNKTPALINTLVDTIDELRDVLSAGDALLSKLEKLIL